LVPFGEYTPFEEDLPWLTDWIGMGRSLTPGRAYTVMPIKATAFKAVRQTTTRTERNRTRKRSVKEASKAGLTAITKKEADALKTVQAACRVIDKAVQKGTLHHNTGARKKSRLMRQLNTMLKK
jgi:small subunit ribosomal protein S20